MKDKNFDLLIEYGRDRANAEQFQHRALAAMQVRAYAYLVAADDLDAENVGLDHAVQHLRDMSADLLKKVEENTPQ